MIRIRTYKTYFDSIKTRITNIDTVFIVSHQDQLANKIREVAAGEIILIVIVPSADTNAADVNNIMENNTGIIYLLKKIDITNMTDDLFVDEMEETQDIMTAIKTMMTDDASDHQANHFMHYFEPNGMHTDPEYNYLGCNGWSLSFNIVNKGF